MQQKIVSPTPTVLGTAILCVVLLIAGCAERRPAPKLRIVDATLATSDVEFEFRTLSRHSNKDAGTWNLTLIAEPPGLRVTISPTGQSGLLAVAGDGETPDVSFLYDSSFYELNYRDRLRLSTRDAVASDAQGRRIAAIHFTLPEQLDGLVGTGDRTLRSQSADRIRAMKDDVHRLHFEFAIDGAPYVVDVAFRLDVGTDWDLALPTGGLP